MKKIIEYSTKRKLKMIILVATFIAYNSADKPAEETTNSDIAVVEDSPKKQSKRSLHPHDEAYAAPTPIAGSAIAGPLHHGNVGAHTGAGDCHYSGSTFSQLPYAPSYALNYGGSFGARLSPNSRAGGGTFGVGLLDGYAPLGPGSVAGLAPLRIGYPGLSQQRVDVTHGVPVQVVRPVPVPIPQPVPVVTPHLVPVALPVPHKVTVVKKIPYTVEKLVPFTVDKPFPVKVIEKVPVPVPQPYPVHVPIFKVQHLYKVKSPHDW